jgi:hypothetical protein
MSKEYTQRTIGMTGFAGRGLNMLPLRDKLSEELQNTDHIREVFNPQGQQQKDSANSHQVTHLC